MDDTASSFGSWLRHRRRELDLTQDELARRVGCARITIRKIEADQLRPSKQMAELLRTQMGVPAEERESFFRFARGGAWAAYPTPRPPKDNLPLQLTSFVGREREIAEIRRLLDARRLLTLTGSGGVGKTRLALEMAASLLDHFDDGVWLVDLAPISDGGLIAQVALRTLGLSARPGQQPLQTLVDHLADKSTLLILDNCEHLLDDCCALSLALLRAGSAVKVLATSREALGVEGEQTYRVPSLTAPDLDQLPSAGELAQFESVQLFVDRAALVSADFSLTTENGPAVAQICRHLDGIPLAIELAAARLRSMPLERIVSHLHDRFRLMDRGPRTVLPRHQTLGAMIAWSYDMLSGPEKLMLQRLSVFRGGRTEEAVQSVCTEDGIEPAGVLDLLWNLTDKSFLSLDEHGRYRMLETVREYAEDRLSDSGKADRARDRHLGYMVQLAEQAEPELRGPTQPVWLERLDLELDNLRAALAWAQNYNPDAFLRLASALWRFWDLRGGNVEGMRWLNKALAMTPKSLTAVRARALAEMAGFALNFMDVKLAQYFAEQSYALAVKVEDPWSMVESLDSLTVPVFYAETPPAVLPAERALEIARQINDPWLTSGCFWMLGQYFRYRNNLDRAYTQFDQSLTEARRSGDRRKIAGALMELGLLNVAQGSGELAVRQLQEAYLIATEIDDKSNMMECLLYQASAQLFLEQYSYARQLAADTHERASAYGLHQHVMYALIYDGLAQWGLGDIPGFRDRAQLALVAARRVDDPVLVTTALCRLGDALLLHGDQAAAAKDYSQALSLSREATFKEGYCHSLQGLGALALLRGDADRAVRLFAARARIRESVLAEDFYPVMVRERERELAAARLQLGEDPFNAAWTAGQAMSQDDMLGYALEGPGRNTGRSPHGQGIA